METQKTQIAKVILRKKNEAEGISLPDFRLYYKPTATKTEWHWHKTRNIYQQSKNRKPRINPHTYGQLIQDIKGKHIYWRKGSFFNKWCWEN